MSVKLQAVKNIRVVRDTGPKHTLHTTIRRTRIAAVCLRAQHTCTRDINIACGVSVSDTLTGWCRRGSVLCHRAPVDKVSVSGQSCRGRNLKRAVWRAIRNLINVTDVKECTLRTQTKPRLNGNIVLWHCRQTARLNQGCGDSTSCPTLTCQRKPTRLLNGSTSIATNASLI